MNDTIQVLLVDDHKLVRDGVESILHQLKDISVIGSVASAEEAINFARENRPDVILMDIMMAGMSGIEATRWIKDADQTIKVLLLAMEISRAYVSASIKSGVDGYLPKDVDKDDLVLAIRTVHKGEKYFDDAIVKLVFEDFYTRERLKRDDKKLPDDLTKREYEVLGLVAAGKTTKELAEYLFISTKTVETHKSHVMEKLGLTNAAGLVKYAIKNNIISVDSV